MTSPEESSAFKAKLLTLNKNHQEYILAVLHALIFAQNQAKEAAPQTSKLQSYNELHNTALERKRSLD